MRAAGQLAMLAPPPLAAPRQALWWLLAAAVLAGAGLPAPPGLFKVLHAALADLALGFLPFLWYCRDSDVQRFRRTPWWNMGMAALLFPTLLLYLWRSRPRGRRLRALGGAAGWTLLVMLAAAIGAGLAAVAAASVRRLA